MIVIRTQSEQFYTLLQLYWYRANQFGRLLGLFKEKEDALNIMRQSREIFCKSCIKEKPRILKSEKGTLEAVYLSHPEDDEDLEFMVFVVLNSSGPIVFDQENHYRYVEINLLFPSYVKDSVSLEKEVRKNVTAEIHYTELTKIGPLELIGKKKFRVLSVVKINQIYPVVSI